MAREPEAAQVLEELRHLRPDFPTNDRFLISCEAKFAYLVDAILDDLPLAGLKT
ncbi:MAG: hypothetical protein WCD80_04815 [Desulfobaccales bacterium]